MAKHNEIGRVGEEIASDFLRQKGFEIVSRNFRRPYGELDIVARERGGKYRFVEVKSVSWETPIKGGSDVSHGTAMQRPEENVHPEKIKRLMRIIQTYLVSHGTGENDWQFDILAVFVDQKTKTAKVRHLENIILGA